MFLFQRSSLRVLTRIWLRIKHVSDASVALLVTLILMFDPHYEVN
jgi:hypothetical protein